MIPLHDIPDEVLAELKQYDVSFQNYGQHPSGENAFEMMVSRRLNWQHREPITEAVEILDPNSFQTIRVTGRTHEWAHGYTMRAVVLRRVTIDQTPAGYSGWIHPHELHDIRFLVSSGRVAVKKT